MYPSHLCKAQIQHIGELVPSNSVSPDADVGGYPRGTNQVAPALCTSGSCKIPLCSQDAGMFLSLTSPGASLICWALSLLCPQVYLLSLVVQVPHLHSHLSGTSSAVLIPCRLFSTYQEPLPGTPTAYLVQSNLYSILYSLIVTVPPFLTLFHVNRSLMIPPTTAPFQKRSSFLRILSHSPICFSHTPVSSFDPKAWDSLWRFCYRDKQRTIKTQRDQLILLFGNQGGHQNEWDFGVWPWSMISKLKKKKNKKTRIQPEGKSNLLLSQLTLKDEHRDMWYLLSCLGF